MNEQPKVQVLTAGGAGKPKKQTRNRGRKKKQSIDAAQGTTPTNDAAQVLPAVQAQNEQRPPAPDTPVTGLEYEEPTHHDEEDEDVEDVALNDDSRITNRIGETYAARSSYSERQSKDRPPTPKPAGSSNDILWLVICFLGIMASFVCYGLMLEYTTSGGRKLHELSFLFITSGLYTLTAAAGRYVRDETPTTIPPARFAILGLTSMGSTWCSVRSLRYVYMYTLVVLIGVHFV
jgi:hypothetical protein